MLSGDPEFGVIVDVSADNEKSQAVAKEFAQSILSKCAAQRMIRRCEVRYGSVYPSQQ